MVLFTHYTNKLEEFMLRKLLSSTSQKKLQLIEYLLNDSKTSFHELATKLSSSISAIKNYLIEIDSEFPFLEVQSDNFSLVSLQLRPFATLMDVYSHFWLILLHFNY
ncbi:hypothetical protein RV14_GL001118 [Enterococcus ratti]|uniref:M protein trans-acting positive regulator (MGA) HTH domain-containing protein n=3 Tax=Enterococcus ratti TaxID=150033 RepID=A0A1L8WCW3_9ENTE|nr:hypothetical protein RV14_GL001118 [Enterococcus ratti]